MTEPLTCAICSQTNPQVRVLLCAWKETEPRFTAEPRCPDTESCRRRLETRGEEWPLKEKVA